MATDAKLTTVELKRWISDPLRDLDYQRTRVINAALFWFLNHPESRQVVLDEYRAALAVANESDEAE